MPRIFAIALMMLHFLTGEGLARVFINHSNFAPLRLCELCAEKKTLDAKAHDHLGSIREVVKGDGTLAARYDYDPYGLRLTRYQAATYSTCDFGYTGHITQQSPITGQSEIVLTLFRAYDPHHARWLTPDPLGEAGGLNLYEYVFGNPINGWDPMGLAMFGLYDSWGEYFNDVGDVLVGQGKGAAEHLSFGLYTPCYENEMQGTGGKIGTGIAMVGEFAATGGSAALKIAARRKIAGMTSKQIRNLKKADRKALNEALDGVVGDGLEAHHRAPLTGHTGTGQAAMFPSIGLPSWIKNSKWNGELLTPAAHRARHALDAGLERAASALGIGNVGIGAARTGLTAGRENCD